MRSPLRVGIVGTGFAQQVHVPAFRADSRCEVVAICASTSERAASKAAQLSIPLAFGGWQELVSSPEVDVVSIAVPPVFQAGIAEAAAAAGKHLFCEKPVALDGAHARSVLDRAAAAGVRHAVDFIFPEIDVFGTARRILEEGELGRIRHAAVSWQVETRAYAVADSTSWKVTPALGGGVLHSFGSHVLHYLEWMLGPVSSLRARLSGANESRLGMWLELRSGCEASVTIACDAFRGTGHRIEIYGSEGSLVLENAGRDYAAGFTLRTSSRNGKEREMQRSAGAGTDGRLLPTSRIVGRLIDAIENAVPVHPNLEQGWRVAVLSDAARDSAARMETVATGEPIHA